MQLIENPQGNYRFLTGIAPYSAGVVALPAMKSSASRCTHPFLIAKALRRLTSSFKPKIARAKRSAPLNYACPDH